MLLESNNAWWTHYCARHGVGSVLTSGTTQYLNGSLNESTWPWHNDGLNVAFCDGHVKWMKVTSLADPTKPCLWDRGC